jgi:hypothetical protein
VCCEDQTTLATIPHNTTPLSHLTWLLLLLSCEIVDCRMRGVYVFDCCTCLIVACDVDDCCCFLLSIVVYCLKKQLKIIKKAIKQPPHTKNTTRPEVKKDPHPLDCCVRVVVVVVVYFCCRLLFSLDCCVLP